VAFVAAALCLLCAAGAFAAAAGGKGGKGGGGSAALSKKPIPESLAWRSYVRDDLSPAIYPKSAEVRNLPSDVVPADAESVDDPGAILNQDGKGAVIHGISNSPALVLDLGHITGGTVQIGILSADPTATVRLAYSEAKRFLGPGGDIDHGSQGRNDDPSTRVDIVPAAAGQYSLAGVRGSERYVWVSVDGAGSASIDYVRVVPNFLRPKPGDYVGHFLSSDDTLNQAWYAGAYTINLDTFGDPARGNKFALTDGAKHDRLVWLGDLAMESLVGAYTVRQMPPIIRRSLQMFTCQQYPDGSIQMASDTNVSCAAPGPPNGIPAAARKKALRRGSCSCIFSVRLPEYTAWFVIAAANHYQLSADRRVVKWLPVMRRAVKFFQRRRRGGLFFTNPSGDINWHPPDIPGGADANTNAVWVRALRQLAVLEGEIGSPVEAKRDAKLAKSTAAALRRRLFDPAAGAMHLNAADTTGNHTQDANAEAVIAEVLKGASAVSALNYVQAHLWGPFGPATGEFDNDPYMSRIISPFISGWEMIARFGIGNTNTALDLIRRQWGQMLRSDPNTTLWEKMTVGGGVPAYQGANADGSPIVERPNVVPGSGETSLAHGWSAGPTYALSAYVAGMRPVEPGFKRWLVQPQLGDLHFAQGQVKTPHGSLASRWEIDPSHRSFRLTVRAPHGTTGTVGVPLAGAKRTIALDGKIVWRGKRPAPGVDAKRRGDYVLFDQEKAGTHTYAWAG